ncbi:MAG: hypothetical protein ABMA02_20230, partial [Saprospiraceae bacterium]
ISILLFCLRAAAQTDGTSQPGSPESRMAKATEFGIPSSPAFNMLNENAPARIERSATLRDVKVDWSLTNGQQGYALSPGLAIEVQPVWMLFFDRAPADKFRQATPMARALSTLSLSMATNASQEQNWLAWAAKINLYRQYDPLRDAAYLKLLDAANEDQKDSFNLKIKEFEIQQIRLNHTDPEFDSKNSALLDSISAIEFELQKVRQTQKQRLAQVRDQYVAKHWNASFLDLAFGRLLTYQQGVDTTLQIFPNPQEPGRPDTARLASNSLQIANQGFGVWLAAGIGMGKNCLLSAMTRYGKRPNQVTGTIGEVFSTGINLRYGTRQYNLFAEVFYDSSEAPLPQFAEARFRQRLYMFTIGGDWRIGPNVLLNFGIRHTKDFENGTYRLQPLMNVNCLMR